MSIAEELRDELKDAMRQKDQNRLDAIRQVQTEVSVAKSAPNFRGAVDDALHQQVIAAYVKKMSKAQKEYEELGERGQEMAVKLAFETGYLSRWLPRKLDEGETRARVREAIAELGLHDQKQAGRLVGHLLKLHGGMLDGVVVNRIVREELAR